MSTPWTPGPWSQSHRMRQDGTYFTEVYDAKGATIATLAWHVEDPLAETLTTDRAENARLIASAPDLYAALEQIVLLADGRAVTANEIGDSYEAAREALAKARGEV
jgi:hypothetical protein